RAPCRSLMSAWPKAEDGSIGGVACDLAAGHMRTIGQLSFRVRRNGSTMKKQKPKTTTLRANADQAAQWTRLSGKVATSQTTNANDELIQIVWRCASKT